MNDIAQVTFGRNRVRRSLPEQRGTGAFFNHH